MAGFSPLLEGDGLASSAGNYPLGILAKFQSPSRRGWSCIRAGPSRGQTHSGGFSPLLEGDGLASLWRDQRGAVDAAVSVPFSKGMVLHRDSGCHRRPRSRPFQSPSRRGWSCIPAKRSKYGVDQSGFSPLLEGDGLASVRAVVCRVAGRVFQSPSRRGWSCIDVIRERVNAVQDVSVPFSKGMVLHLVLGPRRSRILYAFQSPSRRGWSCIHHAEGIAGVLLIRFSPLLEGDGLASRHGGFERAHYFAVSVPFSKGMVLHPHQPRVSVGHFLVFQSPSRRGWSCIFP